MKPSSLPLLLFVLTLLPAAEVGAYVLPWPFPPGPCSPPGCQDGFCNLIVDGDFSNGCPQWVFGGGARREEGPFCSNSGFASRAVFYGSDANGILYQDIAVPGELGSQLRLGYRFESTSSAGFWDQVMVTIREASTGSVLRTVVAHKGGTAGCFQLTASLEDYRGQTIRLQFDSTVAFGTAFRLDGVELWQSAE